MADPVKDINLQKSESLLITLFIMLMLPLSVSIAGWWFASIIYLMHIAAIQKIAVINYAILGFGTGIILTVSFLGQIKKEFYSIQIPLLIPIYIFWSFASVSFLRGMAAGTLVVGAVAGLYMGRREHHWNTEPGAFLASARRTAKFTALITAILVIFIGFIMFKEQYVKTLVAARYGVKFHRMSAPAILALTAGSAVILTLVQYFGTLYSAKMAYKMEGQKPV